MEKTFFSLMAVITLVFLGCGPAEEALVPAGGTVFYMDKPLEGADVTFVPDTGIGAAAGRTDKDGKFKLESGGKEGAAVGDYKVVVAKVEGGNVAAEVGGDPKEAALKMAESPPAMEGATQGKSEIPESYNSPATSGFRATVKDGDANQFEFKLKKVN